MSALVRFCSNKMMRLRVRVDNDGDLNNSDNVIDIFLSVVVIGLCRIFQ